MTFICFIGIDGSGKTTLSKQIVKSLTDKGLKVKYTWSRFEPWISKPFIFLAKIFFLNKDNMNLNYKQYSATRKNLFKNNILYSLYLVLIIPDVIIQNIIKIGIPIIMGRHVVADRYIYDTVVDIAFDRKFDINNTMRLLRVLSYLLPKPQIIFLVDVDEEIALKRKKDIPSLDYIKERRTIYNAIGKKIRAIKLDGKKNLLTLESEISNHLESRYN
ncbi:MAG: dTMP kinase [Candidatus Hodarchaeota archaeon]